MQKLIVAAVSILFAGSVLAQAPATPATAEKPKTAQQMKMKNCNAEAKEKALKGAERKSFMKDCLKGDKK